MRMKCKAFDECMKWSGVYDVDVIEPPSFTFECVFFVSLDVTYEN